MRGFGIPKSRVSYLRLYLMKPTDLAMLAGILTSFTVLAQFVKIITKKKRKLIAIHAPCFTFGFARWVGIKF